MVTVIMMTNIGPFYRCHYIFNYRVRIWSARAHLGQYTLSTPCHAVSHRIVWSHVALRDTQHVFAIAAHCHVISRATRSWGGRRRSAAWRPPEALERSPRPSALAVYYSQLLSSPNTTCPKVMWLLESWESGTSRSFVRARARRSVSKRGRSVCNRSRRGWFPIGSLSLII